MLGFIAVAVVVIVAPGPDFALTVRNATRGAGLERVRRPLEVVTGVVLVAFGVRLATVRR